MVDGWVVDEDRLCLPLLCHCFCYAPALLLQHLREPAVSPAVNPQPPCCEGSRVPRAAPTVQVLLLQLLLLQGASGPWLKRQQLGWDIAQM